MPVAASTVVGAMALDIMGLFVDGHCLFGVAGRIVRAASAVVAFACGCHDVTTRLRLGVAVPYVAHLIVREVHQVTCMQD